MTWFGWEYSEQDLEKFRNTEGYLKAKAYENGIGVEKNEELAFNLYREEAMRFNHENPIAAEYLTKKAEEGNVYAEYNLALYYDYPEWRICDFKKAFYWFKRAADKEYLPATNALGFGYMFGHGVEQDTLKGLEFYTKMAENGNAASQWNLAFLYYSGEYVKKNDELAIKWLSEAAKQKIWGWHR